MNEQERADEEHKRRRQEERRLEKALEDKQLEQAQARICHLCGEPYGFGIHQRCADLEQAWADGFGIREES